MTENSTDTEVVAWAYPIGGKLGVTTSHQVACDAFPGIASPEPLVRQSALAQSAAENREIAMQVLAAEGQAQEAYEKLTAARAEIERLTAELAAWRQAWEDDGRDVRYFSKAITAEARAASNEIVLRQVADIAAKNYGRQNEKLADIAPLIHAFLSTLPASTAPAVPVTATHRHKKRGTEYVLIGIGKMQAGNWFDRDGTWTNISVDMREVAIYHSVTEPTEIWVRPREEFEDGRFETLKSAITEGK